ncbi:mitochondrial RNA pseudouridine synthase Rpusd4-like [Leptopilina heterotoma]|uniref:mitochondrial RNA pseudouridine synthase Rpusd4-like n=1 Tax=Leptopilina heterotoma TaxID=63436 RepID=UPI001CA91AF7|nr:mitochondrial RNA pseudouridine synthase Rpusd4-like [Leptopilina heterotoma]
MKNISRLFGTDRILNRNVRTIRKQSKDKYPANHETSEKVYKEKHPYKQIHPWKSASEFSESLVKNILYNEDGLVAINKPYGIPSRNKDITDTKPRFLHRSLNSVSNGVDYSIADSLPYIAKQLGYEKLTVMRAPERYMTGVTLLTADKTVEDKVLLAERREFTLKQLTKSYWIVTTRLCAKTNDKGQVGMKLFKSPCKKFERPVIIKEWNNAQVERKEVRLLNFEHELISNSKMDLSSLIKLKASTKKWHAIRLFAATQLHSPVLGDNNHGSRIQNIMGTWMTVNPFLETVSKPPTLDPQLLKSLNLSQAMQPIIPVHIHLREVELLHFLGRKKHLVIQAPLFPEFAWTIETLGLKLPVETNSDSDDVREEENEESVQISQ